MARRQDVNVLIRARDQASRQFRDVARSVLRLGAAFVGVRTLARHMRGALADAQRQQNALHQLTAALAVMGKEAQTVALADFADRLQRVTVHSNETSLELMKLGASMGLAGQTLQRATVAAMGLSEAYGMNLNQAMQLVARAASGNTTRLAQMGIEIDQSADSAGRFEQVLAMGERQFAQAEARTGTFAGRMAQLRNAFDDARKQAGEMVIENHRLNNVLGFGRNVLENLGAAWEILQVRTALAIATLQADARHVFTETIPGYWRWFLDNWFNMLRDMVAAFKAVITNLLINAGRFGKALWDAIRGRGWEFQWQPMLEGFKATTEQLPQIAARATSDVEKVLYEQLLDARKEWAKAVGRDRTLGELGGAAQMAAGGGTAAAPGGPQAVESRFMAGASMAVNYDKQQLDEAKQSRRLLAEVRDAVRRLAEHTGPEAAVQVARL